MRIARALLDRIVAHARREFPNECCGFVATRDGARRRGRTRWRTSPRARSGSTSSRTSCCARDRDRGPRRRASARSTTRTRARSPTRRRPTSNFAAALARRRSGSSSAWPATSPRCATSASRTARVAEAERGRRWLTPRSSARAARRASDGDERFCADCGMPLAFAGGGEHAAARPDRHARARKVSPQYTEGDLVRVARAAATRPRRSSSRACCSRRASRA